MLGLLKRKRKRKRKRKEKGERRKPDLNQG